MTDQPEIDFSAIYQAMGWEPNLSTELADVCGLLYDPAAEITRDLTFDDGDAIAALDATGHDYDYQHIRSEGIHRVRIFGLPGGLSDYPKGEGDNLREAVCRALTVWARAKEDA